MSAHRFSTASRTVATSFGSPSCGPDSATVTMASTEFTITWNCGGGVLRPISARTVSNSSREPAVFPSSSAIWARISRTNADASATP